MAVITRRGAGFSVSRARILAFGLFVLACVVLAVGRTGSGESRLPAPEAEHAAMQDRQVQTALAGGFTRVRTIALDESTVRVSFFDGPRAVVEAAVASDGQVQAVIEHDGKAR